MNWLILIYCLSVIAFSGLFGYALYSIVKYEEKEIQKEQKKFKKRMKSYDR